MRGGRQGRGTFKSFLLCSFVVPPQCARHHTGAVLPSLSLTRHHRTASTHRPSVLYSPSSALLNTLYTIYRLVSYRHHLLYISYTASTPRLRPRHHTLLQAVRSKAILRHLALQFLLSRALYTQHAKVCPRTRTLCTYTLFQRRAAGYPHHPRLLYSPQSFALLLVPPVLFVPLFRSSTPIIHCKGWMVDIVFGNLVWYGALYFFPCLAVTIINTTVYALRVTLLYAVPPSIRLVYYPVSR